MKNISEILKEEREKKGYTHEFIEKRTKIKREYLKAIEEGRFFDLPSESYALGFIKNYAEFLNIPIHKASALFRREYRGEKREVLPKFRKETDRFTTKTIFTPKLVFIVILFLVFIGYLGFQYHNYFFGPSLEITSPKESQVISDNIVQISGKTDPSALVLIDQEEIFVNLDGKFSKSLYVFPGDKKITIVAKNRFGKETKETRDIKVE